MSKKKVETSSGSEFDSIVSSLRKTHGDGIVHSAIDTPPVSHCPTGAFTLDLALCGGIPEGKATMVYGKESSGKTTLCKKIVANYQQKYPDRKVVWVDSEKMFDPLWASQLGVDVDALFVHDPESGEQAVDTISALMKAEETGLIVLDSIPACVPMAIEDRSAEDKTMGALAALMGTLCSKIIVNWNVESKRSHEVTVLLINQLRDNLAFGKNPDKLPAGRQINHLPTTKIKLRGQKFKDKDRFGNEVPDYDEIGFKLEKTKHGVSITEGMFTLCLNPDNNRGTDPYEFENTQTILAYAKKFGLYSGGGSKWSAPLIGMEVSKASEAEEWLSQNKDKQLDLAATIISMMRESKNLPSLPKDGYLLGGNVLGKEEQPITRRRRL
jgi:protein RecA